MIITESELSVNPGLGVEAVVTFRKNSAEDKRPFSIIGPLKYKGSYNKESYQDPYDLIIQLSKTGQKILQEIKNNHDKDTNISIMEEWYAADKTRLKFIQRGIKDLIKAKIICEAKAFKKYLFCPEKHTYMINPYFIKCNEYGKAKEFWQFFTGYLEETLC